MHRLTDRQTGRTDRFSGQTDGWKDRQIDKWMDKKSDKQRYEWVATRQIN